MLATALLLLSLQDVEIADVRFRGTAWSESLARARVVAQDGAASFDVPGGAVWTFGDTFLGTRGEDGAPHYTGARSCTIAMWRPGPDLALEYRADAAGVADTPFEFLEGESWEHHRIWPGGGIALDNVYYLYYALIEITEGEPPWNFRAVGPGLARATEPLGRYERLQPGGSWRFPIMASQALLHEGRIYLYEAGEIGGRRGVILARVEPDRIEEPSAYEFRRGDDSWGPREDAVLVVDGVPGQVSVAWNAYLDRFLMASSSDFFRPREIRFLAAARPDGPFERIGAIEVPDAGATQLIYCAYLHPEIFRDDGRVTVVTFCRMAEGVTTPELVEVEWRR